MLAEAYEDNLHIRFANAETDKELIDFVRAWGPFDIPDAIPDDSTILEDFWYYRARQQELKAVLAALSAFKHAKGEQDALFELRGAMSEIRPVPELPHRARITKVEAITLSDSELERIGDFPKRVPIGRVRSAISLLLREYLENWVGVEFTLNVSGGKHEVLAGWNLPTLEEALRWMVWYDEFTNHPVVCCAECRVVFRGETARARKYCSTECGHRATAREAMQNKRKRERAEREGRK